MSRPILPPFLPPWRDAVLPAVVAAGATAEVLGVRPAGTGTALALLDGACLVLVGRRRWPLAACTLAYGVAALPYVGVDLKDITSPVFVLWVAGFALGRYLPDLRGLPVVVLTLLTLMAPSVSGGGLRSEAGNPVWVLALVAPPYAVGVLVRRWEARTWRLAEEAARLTVEQERVRQEAAAAERARIARELHDVLAHSVSAMVVQAGAAEDLVRSDPDRAAQVLAGMSAVGRRALAETGRLLHLIRDANDELGLQPDAGLDRLDELVEDFRRSGLRVDLTMADVGDLPAGVDLSAYRVVQEALTNALRHGSGSCATVTVVRRSDDLEIQVTNPAGDDVPESRAGSGGLGLVGVAERVAVFGGTLRHGREDGRYLLAARFPLREGAG